MLIKFFVNNKEITADTAENISLLEVILKNNINIKANCEGNGACGKCQVIVDKKHYDKLEVLDEELDVLEKQMNATATSRLACQIRICEDLAGAEIIIAK